MNYQKTGKELMTDYDPKNISDIEKYRKNLRKARLHDTDVVEKVFDAGVL